jgi:hypothetical protein
MNDFMSAENQKKGYDEKREELGTDFVNKRTGEVLRGVQLNPDLWVSQWGEKFGLDCLAPDIDLKEEDEIVFPATGDPKRDNKLVVGIQKVYRDNIVVRVTALLYHSPLYDR